MKVPRVLRLTPDDLEPTLARLRAAPLSLTKKQVRSAVLFAPQIFLRDNTGNVFDTRLAFLRNSACLSDAVIGSVVARRPHVLWMDLRAAAEVVSTVRVACPLWSDANVGDVVARVPQILLSSPRAVGWKIEFLQKVLGAPGGLPRVLSKVPLALAYRTETMNARLDVLRALPVGDDVIGRVVNATPEVLHWSIPHKIQAGISTLAALVGQDAVPGVFEKLPAILDAVDAFGTKVEFLKDVVGLSKAQIRVVLRAAPAILTYSVATNLGPKWTFVHGTFGVTAKDVVAAPREIFCANLQQRAMPRYAFVMTRLPELANGIPVSDILRGSDIAFCRKFEIDPVVFRAFVENDEFLLFYSQLI